MQSNPSRAKDILATFISVSIGVLVISFFVNFISIPILPCASIWITVMVFSKISGSYPSLLFFKISIALVALFGTYAYSRSIILSIKYYPQYLTIIGIVLEGVNLLAIISAFTLFFNRSKNNI